ncbi:D-glycerate dehydrogenase [Xinfangfangia sp. D13-10-4-6]|uniref:2-hydroxyacid dehydrogenase n=1 Tax=Pseudogemmobacter hezensis TaxID=2737662 RepID=UPI001552D126|nr:D-glycerate dehydrogenase [Pseudogemmobacter hezensis]NPD14198.1 D-glycerate dehydrogenase [Pseudogemmobacter hezensis]
MKLLITRDLPPRVIDAARARFDVTLRDLPQNPDDTELEAMLRDYDLVLCSIGDRFTAEVFAAVPAPRAKLLANFGAGYNHIDVAAAKAAGIPVTNTPGAVTESTADLGVALLLMAARRLGEGERVVRDGRWHGWKPTQMLGTHVSGKRVGIIGMGRIGKAVARRLHYGFGMVVVFHNRSALADPGLPATQVDFATAMAADFVVVCVPGSAETHHMINAEALAHMAPHGIFVNIARGDVVDEAALIAALQAGKIRAAGLDVYEFEPAVPEALKAMENVVLLPHLGTACIEAREEMGFLALENLIAFADGKPLVTPV